MDYDLFRVLLTLCMCDDPSSLTENDREILIYELNCEAQRRGYLDWIDAYHKI